MIHVLRQTIVEAKQSWTNDALCGVSSDAQLWTATKWQHGQWLNNIPPLLTTAGTLTMDHTEIQMVLSDHFFPTIPKPIPPSHPDDPPPQAPHDFEPILPEEVSRNLVKTSNKSAPGPSGIGYKLLKWCHLANPSHVTHRLCVFVRTATSTYG